MADSIKDTVSDFSQVFQSFQSNREIIKRLLNDTDIVYDLLENAIGLNQLKDNLNFKADAEEIERCLGDPSILFIGQTKSGKSSLINEILCKTIVTVHETPCTSRIVTLEYGDTTKPHVQVIAEDGTILKDEVLKRNYIRSDLINLPSEKRGDEKEIRATVKVQIDNDFLKTGVKLIDSPGRNENEKLDDLVLKHIDTTLPLIVYVIDGRMLLTMEDIADIKRIKALLPKDSSLFFVLTKMDPGEEELAILEDYEDDERLQKQIELQERLKLTVFKKLVQQEVLQPGEISDCKQLHAISSWKIKESRRDRIDEANSNYLVKFKYFLQCLKEYSKNELQLMANVAYNCLAMSQRKCINFFIKDATYIKIHVSESAEMMTTIMGKEAELVKSVKSVISASQKTWEKDCELILKESREKIIDNAAMYRYQLSVPIPEDGRIMNTDLINQCRKQLENFILDELASQIKKLMSQVSNTFDTAIQGLIEMTKLLETSGSNSMAAVTLEEMMISHFEKKLSPEYLRKSLLKRIILEVKKFFRAVGNIIDTVSGNVRVGDPAWKRTVASDILYGLQPKVVVECLINDAVEHIEKTHNDFNTQFEALCVVRQIAAKIDGEKRQKILKYAPHVALLQLKTLQIIDNAKFGNFEIVRKLGDGGQGTVYSCKNEDTGQHFAIKIVKGKEPNNLADLAMELHYTRQLKHQRILPLLGAILKTSDDSWEVGIIYTLMKTSLEKRITKIVTLKAKLLIAKDVAEGLDYLHSQNLVHRDIKSANILLDGNDRAVIADYGLMKAYGLINFTVCGTAMHMADEMITHDDQLYDTAVDVYSFGVLLWFICDGRGKNPAYVNECNQNMGVMGVIVATAHFKKRPERNNIRDDCWELMTKCWDQSPAKRPQIKDVVRELTKIIDTL